MADDIIHSHVILEWHFTPSDFFGEPVTATQEGYTLSIVAGRVEARIDGARFREDGLIRLRIQRELDGRFQATQLARHLRFQLAGPNTIKVRPDGGRDISMEVQAAVYTITGGSVGVRITDPAGNVVFDSEGERLRDQRQFADRVTEHVLDPLLRTLLKSYEKAIQDSDDELVHLYEIREALATRFGGDQVARAALGLADFDWRRFGQLCNNGSIRQGRHRGKASGKLRDATAAELAECRGIARKLLDGYLDVLDRTPPA